MLSRGGALEPTALSVALKSPFVWASVAVTSVGYVTYFVVLYIFGALGAVVEVLSLVVCMLVFRDPINVSQGIGMALVGTGFFLISDFRVLSQGHPVVMLKRCSVRPFVRCAKSAMCLKNT
jgi:drug/metabolite transporter (DMT)-like permease